MKIDPAKVLIPLLIVLVAYFGVYKSMVSLPDKNVSDAIAFGDAVDRQRYSLRGLSKTFTDNKTSSDWQFLQRYSDAEGWQNKFTSAEAALKEAEQLKRGVILEILDEDHRDRLAELVENVKVGRLKLEASIADSMFPAKRAEKLMLARDNKDAYFANAKIWLAESNKQASVFSGQANVSRKTHVAKSKDISQKLGGLDSILKNVNAVFTLLANEYAASDIDYALYVDSYDELNKYQQALTHYITNNSKLLRQLDSSYVKVLTDQMASYSVLIGRANWCESDFCYEGTKMTYPRIRVDEDTFEYFENLNIEIIAKHSASTFGGGFKLFIPQKRWDALAIDPKLGWTNALPYAEYWLQAATVKTWHKYTVLMDGDVQVHDWVSVSNEIYGKHVEHLGMAILTKPLGEYDSGAITDAEPVGMAVIAKPTMQDGIATGSNQYGQWRHSGAGSYWQYYGMYRIFSDFVTPGRYRYRDWSGYSASGRKGAYYGNNGEYGTGGYSTYEHDKYKNSEYSRRNPKKIAKVKTGKEAGIGRSIRGVGPSGRGKGPSGSGK
ncbi:MAG: hypothetical protein RPR40_02850 [Bermanella sp.]